jgi:hypothetical protein
MKKIELSRVLSVILFFIQINENYIWSIDSNEKEIAEKETDRNFRTIIPIVVFD